jgi:hypothetical protein
MLRRLVGILLLVAVIAMAWQVIKLYVTRKRVSGLRSRSAEVFSPLPSPEAERDRF